MQPMAAAVAVDRSGAVTQQNLDEFHLYDLNRTTSLHNGETKQVQFLSAAAIPVTRRYEYDGAPQLINYYGGGGVNTGREFGLNGGGRVAVINEVTTSRATHP